MHAEDQYFCSICYNPGELLHCCLVGSAPARSKMDLVLKHLTLRTYWPSSKQHLKHQGALFKKYSVFQRSSVPSSGSVTWCMRGGALNVGLMKTFE